jgi:hypothetical protein
MTRNTREYRGGDIFSFRTAPATEFSPRETGRYAAFKVLGQRGGSVCYVVLDGIFDRHPTLEQVAKLPYLRNARFLFRSTPASRRVPLNFTNDLQDLQYVGTIDQSEDDVRQLSECRTIGSWSSASVDAEAEWRWHNDRAAYALEVNHGQRAHDQPLDAELPHDEKCLEDLTWDDLLAETPFARWIGHPPFPPPAFVTAARERIRATTLDLKALGSTPGEAQVRAILKACVEWFNAKNVQAGDVIETEEREDICDVLYRLAVVAGHPSLIEETDHWRKW